MNILLTGNAGFIGHHLSLKLSENVEIDKIICVDSINDYYDVNLKFKRLAFQGFANEVIQSNKFIQSQINPKTEFAKVDISDQNALNEVLKNKKIDVIINLAAQAGVRYSLTNPAAYYKSNVQGFFNILEFSRVNNIKNVIYASSSSVYGNSKEIPYLEDAKLEPPSSFYAATKMNNESMALSYSHIYGLNTVGLRFFTVYGPWGRPDMAYYIFTKSILENKPISVFNHGDLYRDFTYIDDITSGIELILGDTDVNRTHNSEIYNLGNNKPTKLTDFISTLEKIIGKEAIKNNIEMQPGDLYVTHADTSKMQSKFGWSPKTNLEDGLRRFVGWYLKNNLGNLL